MFNPPGAPFWTPIALALNATLLLLWLVAPRLLRVHSARLGTLLWWTMALGLLALYYVSGFAALFCLSVLKPEQFRPQLKRVTGQIWESLRVRVTRSAWDPWSRTA